jgi:hypothetical protein
MHNAISITAALLVALLLAGCGLLGGSKQVQDRIDHLAGMIDNDRWDDVDPILTADFAYTNLDNKTWTSAKDKPAGTTAFKNSVMAVKNRIGFKLEIISLRQLDSGRYYAQVRAVAAVERLDSTEKGVRWTQGQTWAKASKLWRLASVKELSAKENIQPASPQPATAANPTRPGDQPVRPSTAATVGAEINSGLDYATGTTQLKTKQNITRRLGEINKQSNHARSGE